MADSSVGKLNTIIQQPQSRKKSRERPLLPPWGRRLRHLNGIAFRNITETPSSRLKGRANDDTSIAGSWRSPSKIVTVQEASPLQHSRSSSDLTAAAQVMQSTAHVPSQDVRPGRRRRRSTLIGPDDPLAMQKMFEEALSARLPDTFFTLHCQKDELTEGIEDEPIYISEIIRGSANPSFRPFDLVQCGPAVSWLGSLTIRLWINRSESNDKFKLLLETVISLDCLQFIGTMIENFRQPLPQNCILFSLSDGIYTTFTDIPIKKLASKSLLHPSTTRDLKDTSSYDSLMKIKTLEECIWDAQLTREQVSHAIESTLEREKETLSLKGRLGQSKDDLDTTQRYLLTTNKKLEAAVKQRDELANSLEARRAAVERGVEARKSTEKHLVGAKLKLEECKAMYTKTLEGVTGQRRRIIDELSKIYTIDPIPNKPLEFTICGLYLPNNEFGDEDEDIIGAALGYTAHLVHQLSFYLRVYLRYPVKPMGSRSYVQDPISIIQGSRIFPLWPKGQVSYRFEYGVFLLNKNIEQLMSSQSIVVMDLRNTLPNLKYLIYVITNSGNAPIPDREWPSAPFRILNRRVTRDKDGPSTNNSTLAHNTFSVKHSLTSVPSSPASSIGGAGYSFPRAGAPP